MPNAIYVKRLSFKYKSNDFYSLSDISLTIQANKCTGIIGSNGAGKSTFISALCGLLPSFEGDVIYENPTKFESKYGEVSTNKKTNAFMKSDQEACEWAMLSAFKALQERTVREGMTDVINITSNYKNQPFTSTTEFECGSGAVMAGVALKGTLVKIAK